MPEPERAFSMTIDVWIVPTNKFGTKGETYEIYFGEELLTSGWSPEYDACRLLLARGITGKLRFWRRGKKHFDLQIDIERGAQLAVLENARRGPVVVKWKPFAGLDTEDDAEIEQISEIAEAAYA
jgi:hypothetical protein